MQYICVYLCINVSIIVICYLVKIVVPAGVGRTAHFVQLVVVRGVPLAVEVERECREKRIIGVVSVD
jgi:hypothetical protein